MSKKQDTNKLAPLEPILSDPDVVEVMIDGYSRVYVEKHGEFVDIPTPFRDDEHLLDVIEAILEMAGRTIEGSAPLVDVRLSDGSRVNVVLPPVSLVGPVLTIRKFTGRYLSIEEVIRFGAVSEDIMQFLRACVQARLNIVTAGGVGSGKTTFLNIVAGMLPPDERIVTVENAGELNLPEQMKRVVRMESRPADAKGEGEVTIRDLVINALRMRPDRLVVGEVRGPETFDLLQAMNTGHDGSMFTIHANSPRDALARLGMQVTYADLSVPLLSIRQMMTSAIDLITYQERLPDGSRKILKVTEVTGMQGDVIGLQDIFEFRRTGVNEEGRITGNFTATGRIPGFLDRFRAAGIELPLNLFTPT
jgi:pilus assembly protein CpaF